MRDLARATHIVSEFGKLSYNQSDWEKLVTHEFPPYGSLLNALGIDCPPERHGELAHRAATRLRAEFPHYTRSPSTWRAKLWPSSEVDDIIRVFEGVAHETIESDNAAIRQPKLVLGKPRARDVPSPIPPSAFPQWRHFLSREPVPVVPGVYLLSIDEAAPQSTVDPLAENIIYIGKSDDSLAARLNHFEHTALGGLGHSAGWTYRLEFSDCDWESLRTFANVYVTWATLAQTPFATARDAERHQINAFEMTWQSLPRLNRAR